MENFQLHSLCIWVLTQEHKAKPGAKEENNTKMYIQRSTILSKGFSHNHKPTSGAVSSRINHWALW
jgi:hypothetical protein